MHLTLYSSQSDDVFTIFLSHDSFNFHLEREMIILHKYVHMYVCVNTLSVFVFCLVCKTLISLQVTGNGNVKLSVGFAAFDVMSCYSKVQII